MGTVFVTELSAKFYFDTRFSLQHPAQLKVILNAKRFRTSCRPREHVGFLTVDVTTDTWNSRSRSVNAWASPTFEFPAAVKSLKQVKTLTRNKVKPTILLRVDYLLADHGPKFAEVLGTLVYGLREMACVLRLEDKYRHRQNAFQFNYSMPYKAWKKNVREIGSFINFDRPRNKTILY